MKRRKRVFLAALFSSVIFGWREFNERYVRCSCEYLCGYNSISKVFSYFGENVGAGDIMNENIQNSRIENFYREALGGIYKKLNRIVFPSEIEKMCLAHGYNVVRYSDNVAERVRKMEEEGRAGIVWLVHPSLIRHHWEAIPLHMGENKKFLQDKFKECHMYRVYAIEKDLVRR